MRLWGEPKPNRTDILLRRIRTQTHPEERHQEETAIYEPKREPSEKTVLVTSGCLLVDP